MIPGAVWPLAGRFKAALDSSRDIGKALAGARLGHDWKYRVGDWRIICAIEDRWIVVRVVRIGNRREVHR